MCARGRGDDGSTRFSCGFQTGWRGTEGAGGVETHSWTLKNVGRIDKDVQSLTCNAQQEVAQMSRVLTMGNVQFGSGNTCDRTLFTYTSVRVWKQFYDSCTAKSTQLSMLLC